MEITHNQKIIVRERKIMKRKCLKQTNVYRDAHARLAEIIEIRDELQNSMKQYPAGKIHVANVRGILQFYLRTEPSEKNGKYISKQDKGKIKQYLQKRYAESAIKIMNREIKGLEALLKTADGLNVVLQKLYSDQEEEIKMYLDPIDMSDDEYVKAWLAQPYISKIIPDTIPVYETDHSERVRSKSELTIANAMGKLNIPYKYECPLRLKNGTVIYPDFTILIVSKRKVVYWEHRGMMDDADYARSAIARTKDYAKSGFYLGDSLFITEETSSTPLGTDEIQAIIAMLI